MPQEKKRACGSCSACCKTHGVKDAPAGFDKPMGKWCEHCVLGKGCSIYESRPNDCKTFTCSWLKGMGEESDKPSKSKFVLDYVRPPGGPENGFLQIWEVSEGALFSPRARELTRVSLEGGMIVTHISLGGKHKKLFLPPRLMGQENTFIAEPGTEYGSLDDLR